MSYRRSPGQASNEDLYRYFAVSADKGSDILRDLSLSRRRGHDWTTIWAALGLAAEQHPKLWDELRNPLIDAHAVAAILGNGPQTVRNWCFRGEYPLGFPKPFIFGSRTKRWIELEVRAYQQPALYMKIAQDIARTSSSSRKYLHRSLGTPMIQTTLESMKYA